jgi:hypothetical protein
METNMSDGMDGRDLPTVGAARWYAGPLPTFEDMRREALRLLGDAQDTLRSDWRDATGPTDRQADALNDARKAISAAKIALDQAGQ